MYKRDIAFGVAIFVIVIGVITAIWTFIWGLDNSRPIVWAPSLGLIGVIVTAAVNLYRHSRKEP